MKSFGKIIVILSLVLVMMTSPALADEGTGNSQGDTTKSRLHTPINKNKIADIFLDSLFNFFVEEQQLWDILERTIIKMRNRSLSDLCLLDYWAGHVIKPKAQKEAEAAISINQFDFAWARFKIREEILSHPTIFRALYRIILPTALDVIRKMHAEKEVLSEASLFLGSFSLSKEQQSDLKKIRGWRHPENPPTGFTSWEEAYKAAGYIEFMERRRAGENGEELVKAYKECAVNLFWRIQSLGNN